MVKSSTTPVEWYNYDVQKWANAVVTTIETRSNYESVVTTVEMEDILGMYR